MTLNSRKEQSVDLERINITIDHQGNGSEHSNSYSDEEEGSSGTGVQVSPSSGVGSHEYAESLDENDGWVLDAYPDDLDPSDSASRPRTANQNRPGSDPRILPIRSASRHHVRERVVRQSPLPRVSRPSAPISPESVDPADDYPGPGRGPPPPSHGRPQGHWRVSEARDPGYASSYSAGPAYSPYSGASVVPSNASQLIPYGYQQQPYPPPPGPGASGYFPPGHQTGPWQNPMAARAGSPYAGHEAGGYGQGGSYYPNAHPYGLPPGPSPPVYYQIMQPPPTSSPGPQQTSSKDDEKFARLEKILLDQKREAEEKEAKAKKEAEEKKAADKKAAEEAAAKKKEADEAAAKEAAEKASKAAAEKAAAPPKEEKKKPIKFKDAVGRKFSFPFHLCRTWAGMEDLIRQAFAHIDVLGPHVAEGHYDLVGPDGEIILPQVWETMIEPDWAITMHMWPIPDPPPPGAKPEKKADGPEQVVLVTPGGKPNIVAAPRGGGPIPPPPPPGAPKRGPGGPPPPPPLVPLPPGGAGIPAAVSVLTPGGKKPPPQAAKSLGLLSWTAGTRGRPAKKVSQKPEVSAPPDIFCRVM